MAEGFAKALLELPGPEAELASDLGGPREMAVELLFPEVLLEPDVLGDERSPALAGREDPCVLELEVGALDGDHADPRGRGEGTDRRDLLPRPPVADRDEPADLLDDLLVHRPRIGVRDGERCVHINIHTIH